MLNPGCCPRFRWSHVLLNHRSTAPVNRHFVKSTAPRGQRAVKSALNPGYCRVKPPLCPGGRGAGVSIDWCISLYAQMLTSELNWLLHLWMFITFANWLLNVCELTSTRLRTDFYTFPNWLLHVSELTRDVCETTVGETSRWQNDRHSCIVKNNIVYNIRHCNFYHVVPKYVYTLPYGGHFCFRLERPLTNPAEITYYTPLPSDFLLPSTGGGGRVVCGGYAYFLEWHSLSMENINWGGLISICFVVSYTFVSLL